MEEKIKVRVFKEYEDGRSFNNLGSCASWTHFYTNHTNYVSKEPCMVKNLCLAKVRWHLIHLNAKLRAL